MIFNVAYGQPSVPFTVPLYTVVEGTAPSLKYSGNNWEMAFTGSCKIKFSRVSSSIDVFLVAGGKPGNSGAGSGRDTNSRAIGGKGGKGGGYKTVTKSVSTGTTYTITIGGSGQDTTAFSETVYSGGGSDGGDGATQIGVSGQTEAGAGEDTGDNYTDCAFGTNETLHWAGYKYGGGGGGGGAVNGQYTGWQEGKRGGGGYQVSGQWRRAGGYGGISTYASGKPGSKNSGGGGGGGASDFSNQMYTNFSGGAGGSGIVIIRNHR